jgi:hypothetical protein
MAKRRRLKVVHKPPGYEAWKDETTIPKPALGLILVILGSVAGVALCTGAGGATYMMSRGGEEPLPTLVVIQYTNTPSAVTATPERFSVQVIDQVQITPTPTPSSTPIATKAEPTDRPDLQATMNALLSAQETSIPAQSVGLATEVVVFCDGAPFRRYQSGDRLMVTLTDSSLRLLDKPRTAGTEPEIIMLLGNGRNVTIAGEPTCGAWEGRPVVYWPVRLDGGQGGYVGYGRDENVWLETR